MLSCVMLAENGLSGRSVAYTAGKAKKTWEKAKESELGKMMPAVQTCRAEVGWASRKGDQQSWPPGSEAGTM